MFQSAVKAEKVVRALEVASQLTAVRSLEGAVKIANHHRYRPVLCRKPLCTSRRLQFTSGQDAVTSESLRMSSFHCLRRMSALAERVQLLIQNLEEQEPEDVMQQSASPSGYFALQHSLKVWHHKDVHSRELAC